MVNGIHSSCLEVLFFFKSHLNGLNLYRPLPFLYPISPLSFQPYSPEVYKAHPITYIWVEWGATRQHNIWEGLKGSHRLNVFRTHMHHICENTTFTTITRLNLIEFHVYMRWKLDNASIILQFYFLVFLVSFSSFTASMFTPKDFVQWT